MAGDARSSRAHLEKELSLASIIPRELPANFLKDITNGFAQDRVLVTSVFGTVYKGILEKGDVIAVKKLDQNSPVPKDKSFEAEVANLMAFRHDNIVELAGFCYEAKKDVVHHNGRYVVVDVMESLLWYKYPTNGALDQYLNDAVPTLSWEKRFKIIEGICKGLQFLHNKPEGPLIHMNILPSSIWLDDNWVPKIADFGLSRIFGEQQTRINTIHVMGKNGYMAPEYLYRGEISTKSDIYSLGMLIIEITTGEKNGGNAEDRSARNFVDKVYREWQSDEKITSKYGQFLEVTGFQQVKACIKIGLKCVEAERGKRPSIEDIVKKLKGEDVAIFNEETS